MSAAIDLLRELGPHCIRVVLRSRTTGPTRRDRKGTQVSLYRMDDSRWPTVGAEFGSFANEQDAVDSLVHAGFGECGFLGAPECCINGQIRRPAHTPADGHEFGAEHVYNGEWTPSGVVGRKTPAKTAQ